MTKTPCRCLAWASPICRTTRPNARYRQPLEIGCRLVDTAAVYGNEAGVGRAIAASGIPRAELFVTTKLATEDHGFIKAQGACSASLERLGLDYIDLYLVHW